MEWHARPAGWVAVARARVTTFEELMKMNSR